MSFWDFVPALVTAGATLYGVNQASKATQKAADTLKQANNNATNVEMAGLDAAKNVVAQNQSAASPGLLAQQEIINRGSALTPEQEQAVADSRTQAINSLKGSSLRGSARATSAIISDTDNRVRNNFMTANQRDADQAAGTLSGQYFTAGNSLASNATDAGKAASTGLMNSGNIDASNLTGQAKLSGQAIGDIGAVIADQVKSNISDQRNSSYKQVV